MAVRFDTTSDYLNYTSPFSYNAAYTFMFYFFITGTGVEFGPWSMSDGSSNNLDALYLAGTAMELDVKLADSYLASPVLATAINVTTWYHVAIVRSGAIGAGIYTVYVNGSLDTTTAALNQTGRAAATDLSLNRWAVFTDAGRMRVAYAKAWAVALTAAEVAAEYRAIRPSTPSWGWWPTFPGSAERARDYSGNGRNWTENGTLTDEQEPPVSWGATPLFLPYAAAVATTSMPPMYGGLSQALLAR